MAVVDVFSLSPDLLGIRFRLGEVVEGTLAVYEPLAGDKVDRNQVVIRDGAHYGTLIDPPQGPDLVHLYDDFLADPSAAFFEDGVADLISSYRVVAEGGEVLGIEAVWRQTRIADTVQSNRYANDYIKEHDIVLELARPLSAGERVVIEVGEPGLGDFEYSYLPGSSRSEAVHISQIGFEPDDPAKVGYLSAWLGGNAGDGSAGPAVAYEAGTDFHVRDALTGEIVFSGLVELDKSKDTPSNDVLNFNGTDVYRMDFSALDQPGRYVVQVEGVGTSFAFEIGDQVWAQAFQTAMQGFYHHRSGIALDQGLTDWERPRSLHPDDGFQFIQSTAMLMDSDQGLNLKGIKSFDDLVAGATGEVVPDAWGGWHDAGDWDRRVQHLEVSRQLMDLVQERPNFAESLDLAVPEAGGRLPDILDEALWPLDFYKRLQKADGGVPGGIEAEDHPRYGETSWTADQAFYVYAPDPWSSYEYAATAARAADVVRPYDTVRAASYRLSAIDAMRWADANLPDYAASNPVVDVSRNLAAAELYKLTGQDRWHEIFLETTNYTDGSRVAWNEHQYEASLAYREAASRGLRVDETVYQNGLDDLTGRADYLVTTGDRGAFGQIINPNTPYGYAYTSSIPADAAGVLIMAHQITGDERYFQAILEDTQFGLGANPDNMVFMTGLGERSPDEALIADALALGELPAGVPLFGMWNVADRGWRGHFDEVEAETYPSFRYGTPVHETFNGHIKSVPLVEYAIHSTMGPTAYTWGYLASTDPDYEPEAVVLNPPIEPDPLPDFERDPDEITGGPFGNKFLGLSDEDGVVTMPFEAAGDDLILTLRGYDIDFATEVRIALNGEALGFLSVGPNEDFNQGDSFELPSDRLVSGVNILSFEQASNPAYVWGVSDILIKAAPHSPPPLADVSLSPGVLESGSFGNRYAGMTDEDGVITAGFDGGVDDLILSLKGFDVDFATEIRVSLNGVALGFLSQGPNEKLNGGDEFILSASEQIEGLNILSFEQVSNPAYVWGVSDILLSPAIAPPPASGRSLADLLPSAALQGSGGADVIEGSGLAEWLDAFGGNDIQHGRDGNDILIIGPGRDKNYGGSGYDVAVFDGSTDAFSGLIAGADAYRITDLDPRDGDLGFDRVKGVEIFAFDDALFDARSGGLERFDSTDILLERLEALIASEAAIS